MLNYIFNLKVNNLREVWKLKQKIISKDYMPQKSLS